MLMLLIVIALCPSAALAQEQVGQRPYELDWAGRTQDHHPPLIDFEEPAGWMVETKGSEASFERSREQLIWGDWVGKLTYRGTADGPTVRILAPGAIDIPTAFDAVTLWVYGNNWAWSPDPTTPQVGINLLLEDAAGEPLNLFLTRVYWKEWFMPHLRLTPEQLERLRGGAKFLGFEVTGGSNAADRVIYLDNLVFFTEEFPPLKFEPRPMRGIDMFPGQGVEHRARAAPLPDARADHPAAESRRAGHDRAGTPGRRLGLHLHGR